MQTVASDQNIYRYHDLLSSYIQLGFKDSALRYIEILFENTRSIINTFNPEKMNDLIVKYETEKKQRQIEKLENQTKTQQLTEASQRILNITFVAIFVVLLLSGFFIIRAILQKRKLALELASKEALYKEELHKQEEIQIRNRISRDLHDDVGATLSSVKAYSEILHDNPDNLVIADLIKENATEMIDRLEVIAWAANPHNDSFGSLIDKLNRFANPVCLAKNIQYNVSPNGIARDIIIPGEIRQNLYLVAKEVINNTIKYSSANNCTIKTAITNGKFLMEIADDGKGFDDEINGTGNGLKNMQSRIKEIGGELIITSVPGNGTQIKIQLSYPFKIPNSWDRKNNYK